MGKTKEYFIQQRGLSDEYEELMAQEILSQEEQELYYKHLKEKQNGSIKKES